MPLTYGEKGAMNEIASVLESQWSNGMLPQIRFVPLITFFAMGIGVILSKRTSLQDE